MTKFIIVTGSIFVGHEFIGPFDDGLSATEFAKEQNFPSNTWHVIPLISADDDDDIITLVAKQSLKDEE